MKNIYKIISITLVFLMVLSFAGCAKKEEGSFEPGTASSKETLIIEASSEVASTEITSTGSTTSEAVSSNTGSVTSNEKSSVSSKASSTKTTGTTSKKTGTTSKLSGGTTSKSSGGGTTSKTSSTGGWVCPNPEIHGWDAFDAVNNCTSPEVHEQLIKEVEEMKKSYAEMIASIPKGYDTLTWCTTCKKPFGNGHNGTCFLHWDKEKERYVHTNYD